MAQVSNKSYCDFFFVEKADKPGYLECTLCACARKKPESGYTNLIGHLDGEHGDIYKSLYCTEKANAGSLGITKYFKRHASKKAVDIWKWIDWIVSDNLPFSFVESERAREHAQMDPINVDTLKKYMRLLMKKVQGSISKILKQIKTFGLITDGWTIDVEHFLGIFATYVETDKSSKETVWEILLSCSVQEDIDQDTEWVADADDDSKHFGLTAEDMFDHIVGVLVADFGIDISVDNFKEIIEFMAADNVSTNRSFCDRVGIPLAGCQGHRLQLGVYDFLGNEEKKTNGRVVRVASAEQQALRKLDLLMGELKTIKNAAILRSGLTADEGDIKPERRIKAKWASLFGMLMKWKKLRVPIERVIANFPQSVTEVLPSVPETILLERVTESLADFESVSKALQRGGEKRLSRYEVRGLFDDLVDKHDSVDRPLVHLFSDGAIVNNKAFENAIVRIQGGEEDRLSRLEVAAVKMFKKVAALPAGAGGAAPQQIAALGFADRRLEASQAAKRARTEQSSYRSTSHVSSTSLICERLFSNCKLIMNHLRSSMDPDSLALLLFLKVNRNFWKDATIIDDIISDLASA
jgi:hypothetical protein